MKAYAGGPATYNIWMNQHGSMQILVAGQDLPGWFKTHTFEAMDDAEAESCFMEWVESYRARPATDLGLQLAMQARGEEPVETKESINRQLLDNVMQHWSPGWENPKGREVAIIESYCHLISGLMFCLNKEQEKNRKFQAAVLKKLGISLDDEVDT